MDRPLSSAESAFHHVRAACVPNIVVALGLDRAPDRTALVAAALAVQARHPLLRVVVQEGTPARLVSRAIAPPTVTFASLPARGSWLPHLADEMNRPFATRTGPLARVLVLEGEQGAVVLVTCDHLIADGHALNVLTEDLLSCAIGRPPAEGPRPEQPPVDARLPSWPGSRWLGRLAGISANTARPALEAIGAVVLAPRPPGGIPRVHVNHRVVDPALSERVAERSRHERSSVPSAIGAALLRSVASGPHGLVACTIPVDVHELVDPPIDRADLGLHAWAPTHLLAARRGDDLWDLARTIRAQIEPTKGRATLRTLTTASAMLAPWFEIDAVREALHQAPKAPHPQVLLSNLGRVALPSARALGLRFVAYTAMVPAQDVVLIPCAIDGRIELTATWTEASRFAGRIPQLLESIERDLRAACDSASSLRA